MKIGVILLDWFPGLNMKAVCSSDTLGSRRRCNPEELHRQKRDCIYDDAHRVSHSVSNLYTINIMFRIIYK